MAEIVIEAGHSERQYWKDLWRYRELFWFLAWRDVLVRYIQTVIGIAWSVIRPLLTMIVFTVIFGRLAGFPLAKALLTPSWYSQRCSPGSCSLMP